MKNRIMMTWILMLLVLSVVEKARADLIEIGLGSYFLGPPNSVLGEFFHKKLIYDDDQDLIWLDYSTPDRHNWFASQNSITQMNEHDRMVFYYFKPNIDLTWVGEWRLPDIDELMHLYGDELGNTHYMTNTSPFDYLERTFYWSSSEVENYENRAWTFNTEFGSKLQLEKEFIFPKSMFVRSGYVGERDPGPVNSVPEPATMVPFGIGLAGLMGIYRRRRNEI